MQLDGTDFGPCFEWCAASHQYMEPNAFDFLIFYILSFQRKKKKYSIITTEKRYNIREKLQETRLCILTFYFGKLDYNLLTFYFYFNLTNLC